jgi:hypothetical protein
MGSVAGIDWQGWASLSGSTIAAILTSVAALIASLAAYRKANSKDENCTCKDKDTDSD